MKHDCIDRATKILDKFPQIDPFVIRPMLITLIAKEILKAANDGFDAGFLSANDDCEN